MNSIKKFFPALTLTLFSLAATTMANATVFVVDAQFDGVFGANPGASESTIHQTIRGEFAVDLTTPSLHTFFQIGNPGRSNGYLIQQMDSGTAAYDSVTHLFTLSGATVKLTTQSGCWKWCPHQTDYLGSMNLAFYLSGENLTDMTSVDGANFITIYKADPLSYGNQWVDLYSPSQIDLNYSAVPLPATGWLFGSGLLGLVANSRRRFSRNVSQIGRSY